MSKDESKKEDQNQENKIHDMASISVGDKNHKIYCMSIIGEIEGHMVLPPQSKTTKYEHVIPELVRIEEDDSIKGLLLLLNTMGGDVEAGLAIAEVIASMKKSVETNV